MLLRTIIRSLFRKVTLVPRSPSNNQSALSANSLLEETLAVEACRTDDIEHLNSGSENTTPTTCVLQHQVISVVRPETSHSLEPDTLPCPTTGHERRTSSATFTSISTSTSTSPSSAVFHESQPLSPATAAPLAREPESAESECLSVPRLSEKEPIYIREVELSASSSAQFDDDLPVTTKDLVTATATATAAAEVSPPPGSPALVPALSLTEPSPSYDDAIEIMQRKIWVRRPGASATLVIVNDDDLVDTVRDVILEKYRNSLGKSIDSPDITLKIVSRERSNNNVAQERILGPDESIGRTLDSYYPGGQTIEEALVIDVPQRRTPKPSPRVGNHHAIPYGPYYLDDHRPGEGAREYFPPMAVHSPHLSAHPSQPMQGPHLPHSMAILAQTGQAPPLPSPGAQSSRRHGSGRPKYVRQHTSSPTIMHSSQPHSNELKPQTVSNGIAPPAPLPTPPANTDHRPSITPTPPNRTNSPHPGRRKGRDKLNNKNNTTKSATGDAPPLSKTMNNSAGLLDGNVPPINVLIVEDNPINMKLLEQFMRRLRVRWQTAMNGREAVDRWRTGGFHLVLMDIQLPVMSGLEATKEIRRLESVNGIGLGLVGVTADGKYNVSQSANNTTNTDTDGETRGSHPDQPPEHAVAEHDKLSDISLFKSPVIIVALTASSLQSDRHEALAVGCNDFLTKPVGFPWMSRKVTEWGCMQALIDFEGWRTWKASVNERKEEGVSEEVRKAREKEEKMKRREALRSMFSAPPPSGAGREGGASGNGSANGSAVETRPSINAVGGTTVNGGPSSTLPVRSSRRGGSGGGSGGVLTLETHREENEEQ